MLLRLKKDALRVPIEGETVTFVAKKPERDMEQRIKVIWIVSLASMMLIVAGRGTGCGTSASTGTRNW